jgi:hypothetical protein
MPALMNKKRNFLEILHPKIGFSVNPNTALLLQKK